MNTRVEPVQQQQPGRGPTAAATTCKRAMCSRCGRPARVCLCPALPDPLIRLHGRVVILMHPHETKRALATVPLLAKVLSADSLLLLVGRKLLPDRFPEFWQLLQLVQQHDVPLLLLWPGTGACDITDLELLHPRHQQQHHGPHQIMERPLQPFHEPPSQQQQQQQQSRSAVTHQQLQLGHSSCSKQPQPNPKFWKVLLEQQRLLRQPVHPPMTPPMTSAEWQHLQNDSTCSRLPCTDHSSLQEQHHHHHSPQQQQQQQQQQPSSEQQAAVTVQVPQYVLLVLDGTWRHAKEMFDALPAEVTGPHGAALQVQLPLAQQPPRVSREEQHINVHLPPLQQQQGSQQAGAIQQQQQQKQHDLNRQSQSDYSLLGVTGGAPVGLANGGEQQWASCSTGSDVAAAGNASGPPALLPPSPYCRLMTEPHEGCMTTYEAVVMAVTQLEAAAGEATPTPSSDMQSSCSRVCSNEAIIMPSCLNSPGSTAEGLSADDDTQQDALRVLQASLLAPLQLLTQQQSAWDPAVRARSAGSSCVVANKSKLGMGKRLQQQA